MTHPRTLLPMSALGLALGLLAACAGRAPTPAPDLVPDNPVQAACRAEARQDPEVVSLSRQRLLGSWANENRVNYDMRVAETRAYRDCMRRNGAAMQGGVESPRPVW